jgi:hypothetical protein
MGPHRSDLITVGMMQSENSILIQGVTLLREVRDGSTPTPLRRSNHTVITHFPA